MATPRELKDIMKVITDDTVNAKQRVTEDQEKYMVYNGAIKDRLKAIIMREFQDTKTVTELTNRLIPLRILTKMVDKLGKVFKNGAVRKPLLQSDPDQELIDVYSRSFDINSTMAFANKMTKLTKMSLLEPYLDSNGVPRLRVLPSHTFSLYSNDPINPEKPTAVIKHLYIDKVDLKKSRYIYWDESSHWLCDGEGNILYNEMGDNQEGINPYGVLPFVYITQQKELLYPIRSNDAVAIQYAVCLLLSDSTLAQKYLSWATLLLTGVDAKTTDITVGAASTLIIPPNENGAAAPDAKYLQPNLNSDEVIRLVDNLIEKLLTTNNLTGGTIVGKLDTNTSSSGIAKMLDSMESTEDIEEQRHIYAHAEQELWDLFAHRLLPVWVASKEINPEYAGKFSTTFELSITFPEIKPMLSKKERIENAKSEYEAGFTTLKRAIMTINPDMEESEADQLISEIRKERLEGVQYLERNSDGMEDQTS